MHPGEPPTKITLQEFFAFIEESPTKAEFYKGEVFDMAEVSNMAGGSRNHSHLQGNMVTALNIALRDQPCIVHPSDMMVHIPEADAVFFPDVQVECTPENDEQSECVNYHPILIVEVLSPTGAAYDRGGKFQVYMKIRSLREYVLIEQNTMQVDVFSRPTFEENWIFRFYSKPEDLVAFPSLGIQISVADIYHKVVVES
jgi:Uma2 family endonuclease